MQPALIKSLALYWVPKALPRVISEYRARKNPECGPPLTPQNRVFGIEWLLLYIIVAGHSTIFSFFIKFFNDTWAQCPSGVYIIRNWLLEQPRYTQNGRKERKINLASKLQNMYFESVWEMMASLELAGMRNTFNVKWEIKKEDLTLFRQ